LEALLGLLESLKPFSATRYYRRLERVKKFKIPKVKQGRTEKTLRTKNIKKEDAKRPLRGELPTDDETGGRSTPPHRHSPQGP
jgi:hypothetical protein